MKLKNSGGFDDQHVHDSTDDEIPCRPPIHGLMLASASQQTITSDEGDDHYDESVNSLRTNGSGHGHTGGIQVNMHRLQPIQTHLQATENENDGKKLDGTRGSVIVASSPDIDVGESTDEDELEHKQNNGKDKNDKRLPLKNTESSNNSGSFIHFYINKIKSKKKKDDNNSDNGGNENGNANENDQRKESQKRKRKGKAKGNGKNNDKNKDKEKKGSRNNSPIKRLTRRKRNRKVRFGSNNIKTVISFISNSMSINGEIVDDATTTTTTPTKIDNTVEMKYSKYNSTSTSKNSTNNNNNNNNTGKNEKGDVSNLRMPSNENSTGTAIASSNEQSSSNRGTRSNSRSSRGKQSDINEDFNNSHSGKNDNNMDNMNIRVGDKSVSPPNHSRSSRSSRSLKSRRNAPIHALQVSTDYGDIGSGVKNDSVEHDDEYSRTETDL